MTQFSRPFTSSLQKIKINTLTVKREQEILTESLTVKQQQSTKSKSSRQTKLVIYRYTVADKGNTNIQMKHKNIDRTHLLSEQLSEHVY